MVCRGQTKAIRMATDKVYQYLTAFLAGEMRKSYPKFDVGLGYGAKDSKPNKGKVAHLCELIENSVFGKRVAYVDADGCAYAYNGEYYMSVDVKAKPTKQD